MAGPSVSLHTLTMTSCLLLLLAALLSSSTAEPAAPRRTGETMKPRLFSTHRHRRDLDLEGLPADIREKIAASQGRTSSDRSRERGRPQAAPNCWVEVDVPRQVGGVCRRIENMPACAVNDYLYINHPDCM